MGQEQSLTHASVPRSAPLNRYNDKYDPPSYRSRTQLDFRANTYDEAYKRHKPRRSADSFKSDNSSTESSGYRSGSSACECRSSTNEYYRTSLYKNDHYKDINKELYKPVKIPRKEDKPYKLHLFDLEKDELKSARLKSYLSETEKAKLKSGTVQKNTGIRNYKPKILSEEEQRKKIEKWI